MFLMDATRTLIEDISSFNIEYVVELNHKKESDGKVFTTIERSVTGFH